MEPLKHYLKRSVLEEIALWLRGRWVALAGYDEKGSSVFIRYSHGKKPLTVSSASDLEKLLIKYRGMVRTIYGSLNRYAKLEDEQDTEIIPNIVATTPSWDIDASYEHWKIALDLARIVVEELERFGVSKSIYLVWSGNGVHVHISENALSQDLKERIHPFDAAYAVVEYVLRKIRSRVVDVIKNAPCSIKIENLVDLKRVFTAPLSLHRKLDVVAVCFKPNDMDSFDISWTDPENFRHRWRCWEDYAPGELDPLVEEAIKEVGLRSLDMGYTPVRRTRIEIGTETSTEEVPRVGRFEVMALLQAARYYVLTGDLEKAKSFGLNRAIFYAWAKYYGPHGRYTRMGYRPSTRSYGTGGTVAREEKRFVKVFEEEVPVSPRGWFEMGGKEQLPEDFDRQIKSKLEIIAPWEVVWRAAVEYVKRFPTTVLKDPQKFYKYVYEPVRDHFVEKVLKKFAEGSAREATTSSKAPRSLLDFASKRGDHGAREADRNRSQDPHA